MGVVMKFATFGRIAVTALLIAAPLGVASAADMPVKAPPAPPPPAFDWNGFYIGVYGGAAWMDQANTPDPCNPLAFGGCIVGATGNFVSTVFPTGSLYDMKSSFNGGGRIGYNWQPTPYTLLGLENDFGYLHLKGSNLVAPGFPLGTEVATTKLGDWYDAYTARVGAVEGHAMFYVKAGGVTTKYATGVVFTPTPGVFGPVSLNTTTNKTLSGWAAGGGVEYGIDMHWSVRAEYLVLGLARNVTNCGTAFVSGVAFPGGPFCSVTHTPDVQTITVGLDYRFH
jgi:outer membrane immunogenic protein